MMMIMIIMRVNSILVYLRSDSMVLCTTANNHNKSNSDSKSSNIILLTMATAHARTKATVRTANMKVFSSCTTSSSQNVSSVSEAASSRSTNELFFRVPETAHFTLEGICSRFSTTNIAVTDATSSVIQFGGPELANFL